MSNKLQVRPFDKVLECLTKPNVKVTKTLKHQCAVEKCVREKFATMHTRLKLNNVFPQLHRELHKSYLMENISYLSDKYESLDASRPWLCYWVVHALSILGAKLDDSFKNKIANFIGKCQSPKGGFGGGPAQFPHLAPTYAAVNTLVILGTEYAYKIIDRKKLYEFLKSVRQPNGSYAMHIGGEVDIRGTYCALAVASLTNIITKDLVEDTAEWISSCQTYEGGFAGFPGMEAHGGYTFCGLAALVILGRDQLCDKSSLLRWLVHKQMKFEGGFQGRTNKLVDGCYSFWQGGAFPILYSLLAKDGYVVPDHLFDERALQEYILFCCQGASGGLIDKPGKMPDVYHTCYTLSGLSIAQHFWQSTTVLGPDSNKLEVVHPLYNIRADLVKQALLYFSTSPDENQEDVSCGFV